MPESTSRGAGVAIRAYDPGVAEFAYSAGGGVPFGGTLQKYR
jgi:hypothetical protein